MKRIVPFIVFVLFLASCANARFATGPSDSEIESIGGFDGTIETVTFPSGEKRLSERRMVVYLPPSYYRDSSRHYPVMYLIHGAKGNETTWIDRGRAFTVLDSMVREGSAPETIVVLPNLNRYFGDKDYKLGHAVNPVRAFWLLDGEAERHFTDKVVRTTDSLFRTIPQKNGRAIAGMSSGALQALYLSANNPDMFDYVGLFSPYTYPTIFASGHYDIYGGLSRKLDRQFANPPAAYEIMIGDKDFFYPHIILYDKKLTRKGYPHHLTVTPGGHTWINWREHLISFYGVMFK